MKFTTILLLSIILSLSYCQISKKITMDSNSQERTHQESGEPIGPPLPQQQEISDQLVEGENTGGHGQMPSLRPPPGVASLLNKAKFRDFLQVAKALKHKRMLAAL